MTIRGYKKKTTKLGKALFHIVVFGALPHQPKSNLTIDFVDYFHILKFPTNTFFFPGVYNIQFEI